ncbi:MAG: hypothetical protein DRN07_00275 [Thermoplasmata archaeon]|nr:MAG: hypothetical protein DRN07_00275 [Thermoplasmata archaeon]
MYRKKLGKNIGSLVIAAVIVASAFTILPGEHRKADALVVPGVPLVITEIMYNPAGVDTGNEWIELYNMGASELNLSGWTIKDDADNVFGDLTGVVIPAYGYYVLNGSDLNNGVETIHVFDATATEVMNITYDDTATENHSLELNEADEWVEGPEGGTPGAVNSVMVPPVTTATLEDTLYSWDIGDWYVGNVTVTLTATDNSSLKGTQYKMAGDADWTMYTGPFVIEGPGVFEINYCSIDIWGAEEPAQTITVQILNTSSALEVTPTTADWNTTHTIVVKNAQGNVGLYAPRETTPRKTGTSAYIQWSLFTFDVSGTWWVVDEVGGEANAAPIEVSPLSIDVNATPDTLDYTKLGVEGSIQTIEGTAEIDGAAAAGATVNLIRPDGTIIGTDTVAADGTFRFLDINIGNNGAGEYNVSVYIGNATYPDASGYDTVTVNTVVPNITLVNNDAVGGFDIGSVTFDVTYPEDGAALLASYYNISIYKGGELYAWYIYNDTLDEQHGPVTFAVAAKLLNLTAVAPNMWEAGDYTIKIWVDVTEDGNWEYIGESTYTVAAAPDVNTKLLSAAEIDVKDQANNSQVIQVQIFGKNMTTYGNKTNLKIGDNMENVTDRIKVEGDVLYAPPKEAYQYWKDGIWNITVFPTKGSGTIYINVTWPDTEAVASEKVDIKDGGAATVEPTTIIVDTLTDITVTVKDNYGNIIANAQVTLYYEDEGTPYALDGQVTNGSITGDGSSGKGLNGIYEFTISSEYAARNIIVVATFQTPGGDTFYAYAKIRSQPAHDLTVALTPGDVLAGEHTEFTVNITRGNTSYADNFEFYILNATQRQQLQDGELDIATLTPVYTSTKANDTFKHNITEEGTYYLYVRTTDKKHDNMDSEPSFEVSKASVTATPSLLVKNVDKNVTLDFTVSWNGNPVNGTLYAHGLQEVASYHTYVNATVTITIVNGTGNLTNVSAIAIGNITFEFQPEAEHSKKVEADGVVQVTTPTVSIIEPAEKVAFLAEENLITIQVKHPLTGNGIQGLKVEITTPTSSDKHEIGETDANGKLLFGIVPLLTGKIHIYVEGEHAGEIDIWVGLKVVASSEVEKKQEFTIRITTRGGKAVSGATVKVDGTTLGTTDENGEIKYKPEEEGTVTITAEKTGYYAGSMKITVKAGAEEGVPGFEFVGIAIAITLVALILRRRR